MQKYNNGPGGSSSSCPEKIKKEINNFDDNQNSSERKSINIGVDYLFNDSDSVLYSLPIQIPSESVTSNKVTIRQQQIARNEYYKERLRESKEERRLMSARYRKIEKVRAAERRKELQEMLNLLKDKFN
ncbi:uncharacterized protein LOC129917176 [Episyrphus balteatus]|uniref:uncharacterized protein LOC129917176 n=1 Tax=Episyrphus balteatus TaxID=286459 RepID=UPI002485E11B|nr:uncharacterized protein LOC129917176 [Episyrphus balteatus]